MFNTIVVGVDGREGGRDALALGDRLRRVFGGELVAVYAYPNDFFVTRAANPDFESVMHGNATDLVENELDRSGIKAHAVALADGSPARALHKAAKWHDSDLIVVGSDNHGPLGRVVAGDVTLGTLHGAECPVVVAPRRSSERAEAIRTIGVGYDGSPESRAATLLARDLAVAAGARLRVISVLQPPAPGGQQLDDLLTQLGEIATGEVVVATPPTSCRTPPTSSACS